MFTDYSLDKLEEKIRNVERHFAKRISEGTIVGEEAITERLIQMLETAINGFVLSCNSISQPFGVRGSNDTQKKVTLQTEIIKAPRFMGRSTVAKGMNSEESISGADAMIVLESGLPGIEAHKGFLFQAKRHTGNGRFRSLGTAEIKEQCQKMQRFTSSAYAVVYHADGFYFFDSSKTTDQNWHSFKSNDAIPLSKIIRLFMVCKIGDHKLNAINKTAFANFLSSAQIDQSLVISTT
ncbi:hypothetical protein HW511_02045 [Asaia siamensis]|uniref:Uncharacterized protein n=1 Tax=Asaia siamensis TaxID=110479 RepID=A0ABQ1L7H1_9PROT|nr:hypothetical protein [Asaia siamensis]GBR09580.1 hypothetical protein AA0323_2516 [Asaia siamensis NRIC 0323]GGC19682.1 hypothetical protein GCM10007207_01120 [Asaia siamensis]